MDDRVVCSKCDGYGGWEKDIIVNGNEHDTIAVKCPLCNGTGFVTTIK